VLQHTMKMQVLYSLPGAWCTWFLFTAKAVSAIYNRVDNIPNTPQPGNSLARFTSDARGFDAPKVRPINSTSWDLWYFDAVSLDSNASVVIVFFTATSDGFQLLGDQPNVTSVSITGSFPNGTLFGAGIEADGAVITTIGQGSTGIFKGTGCSWAGQSDLSKYVVTIDAPSLGITGSLVLHSVSGDHLFG
jgi:hypothetical protein